MTPMFDAGGEAGRHPSGIRGNILLVSGDRAVAHSAKRRNIGSISSSDFLLKVQQLLEEKGASGEKPDTVDVGDWEKFFIRTDDRDE